MKVKYHLIISAFATAIYIGSTNTSSLLGAMFIFFSGCALDADHFLDLYLNNLPFSFNEDELALSHRTGEKLYVIFHSYEINLIFLLLYLATQNFAFLLMMGNLTIHLLADNLFNDVHLPAYFFFWRLSQKFNSRKIHLEEIR